MSIEANVFDMRTIPSAGKNWYESLQTEDVTGAEEIKEAESGFSHYITKLKLRTDAPMDISIGSGQGGGAVTTVHFGPVPIVGLGSELVVNGGFDADSDWTKEGGWSITGGKAVDASAMSPHSIYQESLALAINTTYQWSITFSDGVWNASIVTFFVAEITCIVVSGANGDGTYTGKITTPASLESQFIIIFSELLPGMGCKVDDVSVKEITGAGYFDWKAPRGQGIKCTSGLACVIDATGAGTLWVEAYGKTCRDTGYG